MSKCAKCQIDHPGVGQHPDHPVEIGSWTPFIWFGAIVIIVTLIVILGEK